MAEEENIDVLFDKTKGHLFYAKNSGFIAPLFCNLKFYWDKTIDTACTDGVSLRWNPDFFLSLDPQTRVTVLAHEVWHVALQHMFRRGDKDPERYNIAGDHVINLMLKEHGYYMDGFPYVMDDKYRGWSTEDIYDDLPPDAQPPVGGLGLDIDISGDGKAGSTGEDAADYEKRRAESISMVMSAAMTAKMTNKAGDVPGAVEMIIDEFVNPKLPWEKLLKDFFNELVDLEYSFRRPNRRYEDPILPGLVGMSGLEHLIYYLDISGSISDEDIKRFNSEVKQIKEEFNPQLLTLVTFDTQICDEYSFTADEEFEKIVVTGRGGTSLYPIWEHAKEHNPNAMVVFTDLYVGIPEEKPVCPLIWICTDHPGADVPYGNLIHVEDYE